MKSCIMDEDLRDALNALLYMVEQFADKNEEIFWDMGLGALEQAFGVLEKHNFAVAVFPGATEYKLNYHQKGINQCTE